MARGDGLQRPFIMSTQTPGARQFSDHHEPKARISTFFVPNFYVGCPEFGPGFFARIFFRIFCGFSRNRSHFETRKKSQGENQGPCAPLVRDGVRASQDWSPKLFRFLALQVGGPLLRLVFVHAEATHTLQSDFLLGGRGGVS